MTDDQILQMVKKCFTEEWCEEDGHGWTEFSGKPDAFVKFAQEMYRKGKYDGYESGYDDGCYEATGGNG